MTQESTVLIVDDEPVGRDTLEALLFNQGYHLAFASDGVEALAKTAELTPDLILLDVMMPGMDGFEVCRRLRADPVLAEVPVILVTALDDSESRLRGIEAGADDFVTKPYNRAELRARVRTITRLNRYRRLLAGRIRFEWVIEHAADGYLMLGSSDEVLYANPQAGLYLGLAEPGVGPGSAESDATPDRFLEVARRQYRCEPQEAWAGWPQQDAFVQRSPRYLVRPESATANAFWLQVEVLDLPSTAEADRVVRLRDITAEMAKQQDMRGFHGMVSHKMRTPLTGMLMSLELLTKRADRMSVDDVVELSTTALRGANRLQGALDDILGYMDVPGLARSSVDFDLSQLQPTVDAICSSLGIESVSVSCPEDLLGSRVRLSHRGVELSLWEILENAIKFHPTQTPTVEISVSRGSSGEICLQVGDDGVELSPEHLGQIWTPYYQGEKYFTGESPGMGLGLPTVAALVWQVGGGCRARSRKDGPGVVIELVLPLAEKGKESQ